MPWNLGLAYGNLGMVSETMGLLEESRDHFQKAISIFRTVGDLRLLGFSLFYLGSVKNKLGLTQEGKTHLCESLEISRSIGDRFGNSMNVTDCSVTSEPLPGSTPDDFPTINSATCLPSRHLMIAFEFESQVLGQYRASVGDTPYQLASVINQPAMLFFSGEPPPEGPVLIRLVSATDEVTVFEEKYTPPVCGAT